MRFHHPDATRFASAGPRDAMAPPNESEVAVTALLGQDWLDEGALAAQLDRPLDEVRAALLRAAARGSAARSGTTWRRAS